MRMSIPIVASPGYPSISKEFIYHDEDVICQSKTYPLQGGSMDIWTEHPDGCLTNEDGRVQMSSQSVYGSYKINCVFRGGHGAVSFQFRKSFIVNYTGKIII